MSSNSPQRSEDDAGQGVGEPCAGTGDARRRAQETSGAAQHERASDEAQAGREACGQERVAADPPAQIGRAEQAVTHVLHRFAQAQERQRFLVIEQLLHPRRS